MTPQESARLINAAGGDTKFGELLGISDEPYFTQRVNNWKRRGIPARVLLQHQDVIRRLQRTARSHDEHATAVHGA